MTDARRFGFLDLVLLVLILIGAAGVRVWYLGTCADNATTDGPLQVQDALPKLDLPAGSAMNNRSQPTELDALLHNLKNDHWYGSLAPFASAEEQTAHAAPGYPWFRYWLELVPGLPAPVETSVRWIQAVLGALTAGFYFLFARRAFHSSLVALLTGILCALNPFWIVNTAELNDGVLATFLLGAVVYLGVRRRPERRRIDEPAVRTQPGRPRPGPGRVVAVLVCGPTLVLAPIACGAARLAVRILAFLGFANGLAPWTLRNYQVVHDIVPVVNSAFYHIWIGNNPRATGGPLKEKDLWEVLSQARGEDVSSTAAALGEMSQRERFIELGKLSWDEVRTNPVETLKRRLWAGLYFFFGEKWFDKESSLWRGDGPKQPEWLAESYRGILYAALLLILWLGVIGWRWSYGWREEAMPASLAVFWVPLPYLLSHAESLMGPRLPLDGVLLSYAALALVSLAPLMGQKLFAGPTDAPPEAAPPPRMKKEEKAAYPAAKNPFV